MIRDRAVQHAGEYRGVALHAPIFQIMHQRSDTRSVIRERREKGIDAGFLAAWCACPAGRHAVCRGYKFFAHKTGRGDEEQECAAGITKNSALAPASCTERGEQEIKE
ncbi:MAG: hypothetical protein A3J10_03615 [Candidatus Sungbacteria bacterium RIFCSPLOWO2_02_FULL_54_10]|uniref:Uncharacterized protein n=1 Tax=Candidatus Sungbacteria bacterium RIFCSPHIGHO2_02_FULL_53_17 TaxID=1802275 RepID=A0A1G2KW93_9BACT|nr:MAG: hypothetical protein A3C92_02555 [Candidatus Sungbacteria bacterium RIFCSPHIGHO2_02_FULL_53_17]OHA11909.1 MAG: hypothetical protein A3J10_03615 [Candidatus Sungbacteria bacterium RIFCSPLOWO2_02_FULL_54_10]